MVLLPKASLSQEPSDTVYIEPQGQLIQPNLEDEMDTLQAAMSEQLKELLELLHWLEIKETDSLKYEEWK